MSVEAKPAITPADVVNHNRHAWDQQVAVGNPWTIPVSAVEMSRARAGEWHVLLTPNIRVPADWFGPLAGCRVLCLASGGGQQGPILAAAGAIVTVFDNSPAQLEGDRLVAVRHALAIRIVQGDMADLSCFKSGSFDLVFHPVSNVFALDVRPVWREAARVLRDGGVLLAGFNNPAMYIFDQEAADRGELVARHTLPYSDTVAMDPARLADAMQRKIPLEFSHTLEEQMGGQCAAGFAITAMYEDHDAPGCAHPLDRYMPLYIATRAVKLPSSGNPANIGVVAVPVDHDLPCVRCGYNLRTINATSRCPECGASVALTLELGGALHRTRPAYLGRLAVGCWMLFVARLSITAGFLVTAVTGEAEWLPIPMFAVAALYTVGTSLLTGREHPRLPPEMPRVNLSMRICSAILMLGSVILAMYGLTIALDISWSGFLVNRDLVLATAIVMWLAYCAVQMLEMSLLARLSQRVADDSLQEHAIIAGVGATISGVAAGTFMLLALAGLTRRMGSSNLSPYAVLLLLVALLLFWIWTGYASLISATHLTKSWDAAKARWLKHAPDQG